MGVLPSLHSCGLLIGKTWRAACFPFLHRGARLIRIGAEDTTVSAFVDMCHGTRFTDIGQLTKGRRHQHALLMLTRRIGTNEGRQEGIVIHVFTVSES
jgi:hypothetical protein